MPLSNSHKNKQSQSKPGGRKSKSPKPNGMKSDNKQKVSNFSKIDENNMSNKSEHNDHANKNSVKVDSIGPNRFQVLSFDQVKRLHRVVERTLSFKSASSKFPSIDISPKCFLTEIRNKLKENNVFVKDIRLCGETATHVICINSLHVPRNIDLVFTVDISDNAVFQKIKNVVFSVFIAMVKKKLQKSSDSKDAISVSDEEFKDSYIQKLARVTHSTDSTSDCWSLIAVGMRGLGGHTLDLKFIDRKKRQYEFTVDSFQIVLDTILTFYAVTKSSSITQNLFPTVVVESVSGSFQDAYRHLKDHIIFTKNPEEICGGGLLKYCKLLTEGYKQDCLLDTPLIEKYMCSRFFIDFPDICSQENVMRAYLEKHFVKEGEGAAQYLQVLYGVVSHSTVCLMSHERRQTLQLINSLIQSILSDLEIKKSSVHLDELGSQNWVLDQVFFGTSYFPQQVYVTGPLDSNQTENLNLNNLCGNQILICTGENGDYVNSSCSSVPINQNATTTSGSPWMGYTNPNNQIFCSTSMMCA